MAYARNQIARYRDHCTPPLSQGALARALGIHVNTVQNWERQGAPSPADLLRLVALFVERGAITDLRAATQFWELSGRTPFPILPELEQFFVSPHLLPQTALPLHAPLPARSRIPLQRNRLFTGRDQELQQIASALNVLDATVGICGPAGIGKTQLACEVAHRYGQFFSGGVFWISFADPDAVSIGVASCGGEAYLSLRPDFDQLPLDRQVGLVQAAWCDPQPRLLIFDNCEDEALLAHWRPPTGGCRVLITSRRLRWSATLMGEIVALQVFAREESIRLLHKHCAHVPAAKQLFANEINQLTFGQIAEMLGDLPLALHLAGAALANRYLDMNPEQYLSQLHAESERIEQLIVAFDQMSVQAEVFSPTRHHQSFVRAFTFSFKQLLLSNPIDMMALKILSRASHLASGEPIPRALLLSIVAPLGSEPSFLMLAEQALVRLVGDLGLLELGIGGTLRMHRLVASFARVTIADADAQMDVEQAILILAERLNSERLPAPLRDLQVHMRSVVGVAAKREDVLAAQLCATFGWQLVLLGLFPEAQRVIQRSLAIREAFFGPDHIETAASLNLLGLALQCTADFAEAQGYFERAMAIRQSVCPADSLDIGVIYNNLGNLLRVRGDYERARHYLEHGLQLIRQNLGENHENVARSLNNLGYLLYMQGDYMLSEQYLTQALRIREHILPPQHPDTAQTLNNLGDLLCHLQRYDESWAYHMRALAIREAVHGPDHNGTAESFKNLGLVLFKQGDLTGAQSYFARSLAICEAMLGPEHVEVGWSLELLGDVFFVQGDYQKASPYYERALLIYTARLGGDYLDAVRVRDRIAEVARTR